MFFNTLNTSLHTLVCLISEEKYDVIISLFLFLLASVNIFFLSLIFCSLNICPDVVVLLLGIYTVLCSLNTKVYGLLFILFRLKQSSPPFSLWTSLQNISGSILAVWPLRKTGMGPYGLK